MCNLTESNSLITTDCTLHSQTGHLINFPWILTINFQFNFSKPPHQITKKTLRIYGFAIYWWNLNEILLFPPEKKVHESLINAYGKQQCWKICPSLCLYLSKSCSFCLGLLPWITRKQEFKISSNFADCRSLKSLLTCHKITINFKPTNPISKCLKAYRLVLYTGQVKTETLAEKKNTNLKQVLKIRAPSMLILIFVDNSIENCKFCLQPTQKSLQSLLN